MPDDTESVLRRIASGDPDAFACFYDEWFAFILAQSRRAARGDDPAAADLTQEVFLKLIRSTPMLDSRAALGAWLKRTALNAARDRAVAESRRRAREARRLAPSGCPDATSEADRTAWLETEIARLDAETRVMLAQRYAFGRTLAQIGALLGLSPSAVDGRIGRVLRALRRRAPGGDHAP